MARNYKIENDDGIAVASGALTYGLSRMYEVVRPDEGSQHRAFRDLQEALAWLRE